MLVQAQLPREAHLQIQTDRASSGDVGSPTRTRLVWTALGFAAIVLVGLSTCSLHPFASHADSPSASRKPSPAVAFAPGLMPVVTRPGRPQAAHPVARPTKALARQPPPLSMMSVPGSTDGTRDSDGNDPEGFKWPWAREKKEGEVEKENPIQQIKKFGVAGVVSYALWEGGFWTIGGVGGLYAYYLATGHWPDLSNPEDSAKVGGEAFAFVNLARFAVPLRIGLAVGTAPWVDENIIQRFGLGDKTDWTNFAEDFKVVDDELGFAVSSTDADAKRFLTLVSETSVNKGRKMEIEKQTSKGPDGQPVLTMKWKTEVHASDLDHNSAEDVFLQANYKFPLQVSGSTTFTANEDKKIASMNVGSWSINGQQLDRPDIKKLELESQDAVEKWARDMALRSDEQLVV